MMNAPGPFRTIEEKKALPNRKNQPLTPLPPRSESQAFCFGEVFGHGARRKQRHKHTHTQRRSLDVLGRIGGSIGRWSSPSVCIRPERPRVQSRAIVVGAGPSIGLMNCRSALSVRPIRSIGWSLAKGYERTTGRDHVPDPARWRFRRPSEAQLSRQCREFAASCD
jgi:hypothetical protein